MAVHTYILILYIHIYIDIYFSTINVFDRTYSLALSMLFRRELNQFSTKRI